MACGTPVVALRSGALPEIVEPGMTGHIADEPGELAALVEPALRMDRAVVRDRARARFGIRPVAERYAEVYRALAA